MFTGWQEMARKAWPPSTFVLSELESVTTVTDVTDAQLTCTLERETMAIDFGM
jgi:hypothetical protein